MVFSLHWEGNGFVADRTARVSNLLTTATFSRPSAGASLYRIAQNLPVTRPKDHGDLLGNGTHAGIAAAHGPQRSS